MDSHFWYDDFGSKKSVGDWSFSTDWEHTQLGVMDVAWEERAVKGVIMFCNWNCWDQRLLSIQSKQGPETQSQLFGLFQKELL